MAGFPSLLSWIRKLNDRSQKPCRPISAAGIEPLENRDLLAIMSAAPISAESKETDVDPITISAIHLRVGDREITVDQRNQVVTYSGQEEVRVVGIDYQVAPTGQGLDGTLAFEGYVRRSKSADYLGEFDYSDGRFGAPEQSGPLQTGSYRHSGLEGGWGIEDTANRLSVALVRYFGDDFRTEDRFFVNFQPEKTDLVMLQGAYRLNGLNRAANFYGRLLNDSVQAVATYSEVNVFLASDLSRPVWVGTFERTLQPGEATDFIEYLNRNPNDAYSERWVPTQRGSYIVKVFADPEQLLTETNELNNVRWTTFEVR